MESVRCKFRCETVTQRFIGTLEGKPAYTYDVAMYPVSGGSKENEQFWKWTPSGKFEFNSVNAKHFAPGKEYYIDLTPAPPTVE